jgi:hypothetical protein
MKASPLLLVIFLSAAPADAGPRFGGAHALAQRNLRAVSDIEPGPVPPPPPALELPQAEPASFEAPVQDPVYLPQPYLPLQELPLRELPPVRMLRPGPQILYLRKPSNRRGPVVIYGVGRASAVAISRVRLPETP